MNLLDFALAPIRHRAAVLAEADRLQAAHGELAYHEASAARRALLRRDHTREELRFAAAVRAEIARRIGHEIEADSATGRPLPVPEQKSPPL